MRTNKTLHESRTVKINGLQHDNHEPSNVGFEALRAGFRQDILMTAFRANPIPGCITTREEGRFIEVNDSFLNISGLRRADFIGRTSVEVGLISIEQRKSILNDLRETGHINNLRRVIKSTNGDLVYRILSAVSIHSNSTDYLFTELVDATGHAIAQDSSMSKRSYYSGDIDLALDGIVICSPDGVITEVNKYMCDLLNMHREKLLGKPVHDLLFSDDRRERPPVYFDLPLKEQHVVREQTLRLSDAGEVHVEICTRMMPDGNFHAIFRNVTERKRKEDGLTAQLNSLEAMVDKRTAELEAANNALRVILKCRGDDQKNTEDKIQANVNQSIMPLIKKLKQARLNGEMRDTLSLLEKNLYNITESFISTLSTACRTMSPKEIQVASLIRQGKRTK